MRQAKKSPRPTLVYSFGAEKTEGRGEMKNLLGGKGANLAEMASLGLPVPPGFTITTEVCTYFHENEKAYPEDLSVQVDHALAAVGRQTGRLFSDASNPLLVSVRSGARASMPGMMDTVLNLGLNDDSVLTLARTSGDERFAYDSYRRFIQMYSNVVLEVDSHNFEEIIEDYKDRKGFVLDTDLSAADWREVIGDYKAKVVEQTGKPFPQDAKDQLWGAIGTVFSSWMNARAITYRRLNNIPAAWGTAVNVQAMVFGNMGETSATGVAFTRNPSTGVKELYGEFLVNAQGEDVVAGIRTPQNITEVARKAAGSDRPSLEAIMPDVFKQFVETTQLLERHYKDVQDLEFTVERGKLWMLQTRNSKRTARAALRIAVDLAHEGVITRDEAITRIEPMMLQQSLLPTIDPKAKRALIATGVPASPGAASGEIVFSADDAKAMRQAGRKTILVRIETSPEDIHGVLAAEGIVTTRGGMTSHAAVATRGMGKPCVAGAGSIRIDYAKQTLTASSVTLKKGDMITIDGSTGQVLAGAIPLVEPTLGADFATLLDWADRVRRMKVRANAETPLDARAARSFGAEGIGLCRTEHMFFDGERIVAMREMILADNEEGRRVALDKLLPMQRRDFAELFAIMTGLPVTIRLLDPPLHEFLPETEAAIVDVAEATGSNTGKLRERIAELRQINPMLGFRGVRLVVRYPEIAEMQARAIFEGAIEASKKTGKLITAEIMVPLVMGRPELEMVKQIIVNMAAIVAAETGVKVPYHVGAMIELPSAALRAGEIAKVAEFLCFGTNDLTQTTLGVSRDDAASFLGRYTTKGLLPADPFATLDLVAVGELISIAAQRARETQPEIKLGICGEHGGDPASIAFCESVNLDYVSCSPYRIPGARLAAAQASLGGSAPST